MGLAATAMLLAAPATHAATLPVTKLADTSDGVCSAGDCSLREAVQAANATGAEDEVVLPAGVVQITRFGVDDASSVGDLDVTQDLIIRGAGAAASTIQNFADDRVLDLLGSGTDLRLRDVTIAGGRRVGGGSETGGGVASAADGLLSIERAVFRGNLAQGAASSAYGGAVYKSTGRLEVRDSAFVGNRAFSLGFGGAVFLNSLGTTAAFENVTMAGNSASGSGGALFSNNAIAASLSYVTITGNQAGSSGGAISGDADSFTLRSSVVGGNSSGVSPDCEPDFNPTSAGGNVGPSACGLAAPADTLTAEPQLGPLTATAIPVMEPLAGSPAIDRAAGACPAADARGLARPQGGACDAGAGERAVAPPAPPTPGAITAPGPATPGPTVFLPGPPRVVVAESRVTLPSRVQVDRRRRRVAVQLRCTGGAPCTGTLRLTARRGSRTVTLATARFVVPSGASRTIAANLTAAARSLLRRRPSLSARLRVEPAGAQTRTVSLRR